MKHTNFPWGIPLRVFFSVCIAVPLMLTNNYCNPDNPGETDSTRPWVNYNLYNNGTTGADDWAGNVAIIQHYLDSIIAADNANRHFNIRLAYNISYCPCDSNLINIDAKTVAGVSVNPPPPPPPPPAGSGEGDSLILSNINMSIDDTDPRVVDSFRVKWNPVSSSKVLAIIDTGLDTVYFNRGISKILWRDPVRPTMYNFIPGEDLNTLVDDHDKKHGTRVTSMALSPSEEGRELPSLMILKALDKNKLGTTFSVSCAMSYAIQNKATLINASLGYEGNIDDGCDKILKRYVELSDGNKIPVFAAAGNVMQNQMPGECDIRIDGKNKLEDRRLFYPACLSNDYDYLISVTGLKKMDTACANQNYDSTYISVGLLNFRECCRYAVPTASGSIPSWNRGSSFATPVVAGLVMKAILINPGGDPLNIFHSIELQIPDIKVPVTKEGKYILWNDRH